MFPLNFTTCLIAENVGLESWETSSKQDFWVVRRKEWFFIYKNVQLFLQFWNSEIASRKTNPFRVILSSLAPRYFLHRLRELISSSAFPFDYSYWLFVSANQHWLSWQSRHKNRTKHVRSGKLPVSQIRFKFWLFLKNTWFKILRFYFEISTNQIAGFST